MLNDWIHNEKEEKPKALLSDVTKGDGNGIKENNLRREWGLLEASHITDGERRIVSLKLSMTFTSLPPFASSERLILPKKLFPLPVVES